MEEKLFGTWVRQRRGESGSKDFISQAELAEESGLARSYLSRIESGSVRQPSFDTRQRIHKVFGTTDDDLVAEGISIIRGGPYGNVAQPTMSTKYTSQSDNGLSALLSSYFDEDRARARIVELLPSLHGMPLALLLQAAESNADH